MEDNSDLKLAMAGGKGIFPNAGRKCFFKWGRAFAAAAFDGKPRCVRSTIGRRLAVFCGWLALVPHIFSAPLMKEGFNYPAGTALASNPPWSGVAGSAAGLVGGNLSLTNLQGTLPPGNLLHLGGGGSAFAYRNFSDTPVAAAEGAAVYCSALVNCTLPATTSGVSDGLQFIACLLPAGGAASNHPYDPVDLYMAVGPGGCRLAVRSEHSTAATASAILLTNTTHFIVCKYTFGATNNFASVYIDPVPGAPEPAVPDARTSGPGSGGVAPTNLQVVLFQTPVTATGGGMDVDTVRVGTNWADVTPQIVPTVFYAAADAGAGFFGGENVIFTNTSGSSLYAWSSPDPSVSVTNWTLEGPLSEIPLGATGNSRYGITLNPQSSPVYYIFAQTNTGPYPLTEWVTQVTTPDFANFSVNSTDVPITADGFLEFSAPPQITQPPAGQTVLAGQNASFSVAAIGPQLGYLWLFNNTAIASATGPTLSLTNVTAADVGTYSVVVDNPFGEVMSGVADLTVASPPSLHLNVSAPGTIQLNVNAATGLTYVVEATTNLVNPVWAPILTNTAGGAGTLNLKPASRGASRQFFRLVIP